MYGDTIKLLGKHDVVPWIPRYMQLTGLPIQDRIRMFIHMLGNIWVQVTGSWRPEGYTLTSTNAQLSHTIYMYTG